MPRDSANVYTLPEAPFAPNTLADPAPLNSDLSDIAAALTDSLCRSTETTVYTRTFLVTASAGAALTNLGVSAFVQTIFDDANAAAVMTTLGGTATGQALFTAANAGAARTAIGATATGSSLIVATDAASARAVLSLGTMAIQNATGITVDAATVGTGSSSSAVGAVAHLRAAGNALLSARDETNSVEALMGAQAAGARVGAFTNHALLLVTNNTDRWQLAAGGDLTPATDNTYALGSGVLRPIVLYAVSGTINTSDATEKTSLRTLSAAELRAAKRIASGVGIYQWLTAVSTKGGGAREHVGVTAQAVAAALTAEGLDPARYAFWCRDDDAQGRPRYGVRYDQLAMFLAAAQEQRLAALEG